MKILVIGSGGREHAICWSISNDSNVEAIYCAPGNGGTQMLPKCKNIQASSLEEILLFAKDNRPDLTIVGSEELLVQGIVDEFEALGLKIFGPNKKAAILEGSKAYAKAFMKKYGVKTAAYETFTKPDDAKKYISTAKMPIVVKASGLAAGKGVIICKDLVEANAAIDEIMVDKAFKDAGNEVVIEEFLDGVEASILSVTDSKVIVPFISAKDHKKIGEGEQGLNTGGMGAIAPNPYVTKDIYDKFVKNILEPTLKGIKEENMDFAGVIFFGLMIQDGEVYLLEYNMRMGDPETQAILPLLETSYVDIINVALERRLEEIDIKWKNASSCCVCLVSGGYPEAYDKGHEISGMDTIDDLFIFSDVKGKDGKMNIEVVQQIFRFVAGAKIENDKLITSGGRVLNIVALGENLDTARDIAYDYLKKISFDKMYYRKDIGKIK